MKSLNHRLSLFRGRLLRAAGLAAIGAPLLYSMACTSEVVVIKNDGSGGASSTTTVTATSTNGTSVTASNASGTSVAVTASGTSGPTTATGVGGGGSVDLVCFPMFDGVCPAVMDAESTYGPCTYEGYWIDAWISGPFIENDECCYEALVSDEFCGVGRPLMLEDGAAVAPVERGSVGWLDDYDPDPGDELSRAQRAVLAAMWTRDGLFEHASVASFARVSLELMALGAPAELVEDSHVAALDEIRHAKLCLSLASRFSGEPIGVGPLQGARDALPRQSLAEMAVATLIEGCIGETVAASVAREQQLRARDGEVRQVLGQIAEDEARHAELAWRTVAWALRTGGEEVRQALIEAVRHAPEHMPAFQGADDGALERYGRLSQRDIADVARRTLVEVVLPCAHALLATPSVPVRVRRQGSQPRV